MARVKLSEYRAKLLLEPDYNGVRLVKGTLPELDPSNRYVVKVDQGIKKRGKQGLIILDVSAEGIPDAVEQLAAKGFTQFLAEPMITHDQELYVSFERVRGGIVLTYSPQGGIDVEEHADQLQSFTINPQTPRDDLPLPASFIDHVISVMDSEHLSFVEINPLIFDGDTPRLLDAAVLADSEAPSSVQWTEADIANSETPTEQEKAIKELAESSTAAFSFSVLNANAPVWLLLSGGGASITIADEANNLGQADKIGNYGEYSGGPTAEETRLYTSEVIQALLNSTAQKKALVIAGGVANFTDVRSTFKGVVQALKAHQTELQDNQVKVYVRRGGPNEREGLKVMGDYLESAGLFGSLHGSETLLTVPIIEALEYVHD